MADRARLVAAQGRVPFNKFDDIFLLTSGGFGTKTKVGRQASRAPAYTPPLVDIL